MADNLGEKQEKVGFTFPKGTNAIKGSAETKALLYKPYCTLYL